MTADAPRSYPAEVTLAEQKFTLRKMTVEDGQALLDFATALPDHDKLYMRRDISKQSGIDKWTRDIANGIIHTFLAEKDGHVVGYSTINLTDLDWTRHVADLRVSVAESTRMTGLGRLLTREAFNQALILGLERLIVRMTPDQIGARALFEEVGFRPEALLKDHVKDQNGDYHDLLVMAVDLANAMAQRNAFGH